MVITLIEKACELLQMFYSSGYEAYVVGGFVRDHILGIESNDIDITTNATPKEIKEIFRDDENVLFLGYQENPYKYLKICDYNVLLSDSENMSLSLLEAKILGIPNIVTDFPSAPEEVTELKNGFILSREDTDSYKDKVDLILKEKSNLKYNLKDFKYDLEDIIDKWEQILNE